MVLKSGKVWQPESVVALLRFIFSLLFQKLISPSPPLTKYRNHTCLWCTGCNSGPRPSRPAFLQPLVFFSNSTSRFTCAKLEYLVCQKDVPGVSTSGQQQFVVSRRPRGKLPCPVFACVFAFALPLVTSSGLTAAGRSLGFSCDSRLKKALRTTAKRRWAQPVGV